jgi:hypothetical protein
MITNLKIVLLFLKQGYFTHPNTSDWHVAGMRNQICYFAKTHITSHVIQVQPKIIFLARGIEDRNN